MPLNYLTEYIKQQISGWDVHTGRGEKVCVPQARAVCLFPRSRSLKVSSAHYGCPEVAWLCFSLMHISSCWGTPILFFTNMSPFSGTWTVCYITHGFTYHSATCLLPLNELSKCLFISYYSLGFLFPPVFQNCSCKGPQGLCHSHPVVRCPSHITSVLVFYCSSEQIVVRT